MRLSNLQPFALVLSVVLAVSCGGVISAPHGTESSKSRPASEVIPASVTVVTVAAFGPWPGNLAPVTITSVPVVRRLAALINALPLSTVSRGIPCPMGVGFMLTFRDAVGGPAVAVAVGPAECGVVHLTLNGKGNPDLQPPSSYRATVLKITGLQWEL
jgi:hypothetical protein